MQRKLSRKLQIPNRQREMHIITAGEWDRKVNQSIRQLRKEISRLNTIYFQQTKEGLFFRLRFLPQYPLRFYHLECRDHLLNQKAATFTRGYNASFPHRDTPVSNARRLKVFGVSSKERTAHVSYIISDTNEDIGCRLADR